MEEAANQVGARYVAVDRVAKLKRSKKVREGWAAVAIVCGDKLLCFKRMVEGGARRGGKDAARGQERCCESKWRD